MEIQQINFQGQQKTETKTKNKGILKGMAAGGVSSLVVTPPLNLALTLSLAKFNNGLSSKDIDILEKAAANTVTKGELKDISMLQYIKVAKTNLKQKIAYGLSNNITGQISAGINAGQANGVIYMPERHMSLMSFHEMGHALNYNFSKLGKTIQQARLPLMALAGIIGSLGYLIKTPMNAKEEDGTPKKGIKQFIKNHIGILSTLPFVPIVAEEALASAKGEKIAQNMLKNSPNLIKKIKFNNRMGLLTYILSAVGIGLSAHIAAKIKDKAQEKYEQSLKNEQ